MRITIAAALCAMTSLAAADLSGTYKGTWSGASSGDFVISLKPDDNGAWKSDVTFTIEGQEVKCHVTSVKVDESKVEVVYDFAFGDTKLQSTVNGQLNGKTLEGTYKTKTLDDGSAVDEGTWNATAS